MSIIMNIIKELVDRDVTSKEDLIFSEIRDYLKYQFLKEDWITVYSLSELKGSQNSVGIYSSLVIKSKIAECCRNYNWDIRLGDCIPGTITSFEYGQLKSKYFEVGDKEGFKPLIHHRFWEMKNVIYQEVLQEFILFHNLHFVHKDQKFVCYNEDGEERTVITMINNLVQVRQRELRQYLKYTQQGLLLFFDIFKFSLSDIEEYELSERECILDVDIYHNFNVSFQNCGHFASRNFKSNSRLLGKIVFPPTPLNENEEWPLDRTRKYEEFIIGIDEMGDESSFTCDPDKLADYFGGNEGAPHQLTPVYFKKEVLKKYYSNTDKYEVGDSYIKFKSGQILDIDNHQENEVIVYLCYLGEQITNKEQLYWKSFNIAPNGIGLSDVKIKRDMLGIWADAERLDFILLKKLKEFNQKWKSSFGWELFKDLRAEDQYRKKSFRIPLDDGEEEFDGQILSLTKLMVDSLNQSEIAKFIPKESNLEGIKRLELFFDLQKINCGEGLVNSLLLIQSVRSTCVAHRRGKKFERLWSREGFVNLSLSSVFKKILTDLIFGLGQIYWQNGSAKE